MEGRKVCFKSILSARVVRFKTNLPLPGGHASHSVITLGYSYNPFRKPLPESTTDPEVPSSSDIPMTLAGQIKLMGYCELEILAWSRVGPVHAVVTHSRQPGLIVE